MSKALQEITQEALELPHGQRLALAQFLLTLEESAPRPEIDAAWDAEIRARLAAYDAGRVKALPWERVREAMGVRFAR